MPLRSLDPFEDLTSKLNPKVNPYVSKLATSAQSGELPIKYGPMLRAMPGTWKDHFALRMQFEPTSLNLEIGCHVGQTLRELSHEFTQDSFIGMDITFKRVVTAAETAVKNRLKNIEVILADAKNLGQIFAPGELDGVFIFFPDPWEKKKSQQHNRIIEDHFCKMIFQCVKPGGFFWLKTDHIGYFEDSKKSLELAGWQQHQTPPKFFNLPLKTKFEKRFEERGILKNESLWLRSTD